MSTTEVLDSAVFAVPSQTSRSDRSSLLALQYIVQNHVERYVYLEIGSHLGGTLTPHLIAPACRLVYSVDARPASQLDERGVFYDYPDNSTERMLETLRAAVPVSTLLKLITIDKDIIDVNEGEIGSAADLILIDSEHTNTAVFRDFVQSLRFMKPSFIAVFHDAHLLFDGLLNIEQFLKYRALPFTSYFLPDCIFTIAVGEFAHVADQPLLRMSLDRQHFISSARASLWREIGANVALMEGDRVGHRPGV